MRQANNDPSNQSRDYQAMAPYWRKVDALLGGIDQVRQSGKDFLPMFPDESFQDYEYRRKTSKLTNIYSDIVSSLAQRPFGTMVQLTEDSDQTMADFAEDVDGRGNSLHLFAGDCFFEGLHFGIDWILVDYPNGLGPNATIAQERAAGVRPYWVRYRADQVLAVYSDIIEGQEQFTHVRMKETHTERNNFSEKEVEHIRVFNREKFPDGSYGPATWELWRKVDKTDPGFVGDEWIRVVDPRPLSIGVIPLVPFRTGRRKSGWCIDPPMQSALELQIDLYQQESALKYVKGLSAFPMLSGNGVTPPDDGENLVVGPKVVLFAPPQDQGSPGSWSYVEPDSQSLQFLANDIKETSRELRELGRQPLTADSGNLTVITTAVAADKGNSAIEAWAMNLKLALEQAFNFTALWLKQPEAQAEVKIDTEFDKGFGDNESFAHVIAMRQAGDISRKAELEEAQRRGILSSDFDIESDAEELVDDISSIEDEDDEEGLPPREPAGESDDDRRTEADAS